MIRRNGSDAFSGSRQQIIPLDCAGFGLAYKAHPAAHIEIRVGGCNAVDWPKDKQDVELFFAGALTAVCGWPPKFPPV